MYRKRAVHNNNALNAIVDYNIDKGTEVGTWQASEKTEHFSAYIVNQLHIMLHLQLLKKGITLIDMSQQKVIATITGSLHYNGFTRIIS